MSSFAYFEIIAHLIPPIRPTMEHVLICLNLTAEKMDAINESYISDADGYGVQVRLYIWEGSTAPTNTFPDNLVVQVNAQPCVVPETQPIDITANLILEQSHNSNKISVKWSSGDSRIFFMSVLLVKKPSVNQMVDLIRNGRIMAAESVQKMFLLDDAVRMTPHMPTMISLKCPVGKKKIQLPCRGLNCSHFLCFDAGAYLEMNERLNTWECPVCHKGAPFEDLVIDGYFYHILNSGLLGNGDFEVLVYKDGSWCAPSSLLHKNVLPITYITTTSLTNIEDDIPHSI
ncbi:E3 SUMO-protein ligase PIAS3-like isoform X2 [Drosophila pseudoobscura]|uniref:E3 SUMO-protein ligase PIAS3-like isoform X2 n=1 Tax=Drosophila pseudoobscura pseudoobscura TaxID=46245 RepID=A0A0R3NZQ5_DROPS|nr:E3 SUMO-protein ligase PIAS3 isoform X2 [Drosophila pseudoobscura]